MKNLTAFIAQQNFHVSLFGGKQLDVKNLSTADRASLLDALDSALSPENLCCDGELRGNGALRELQSLEGK
jgi:hypothetical protein